MYSIIGLETVFDVMAYTVKAMDDSGFMPGEIEDYITEAIKDNNFNLIEISKDYLEKCNEVVSANNHCEFEDTWRDHYYSSLWGDDLDSDCNQWDDDGRYDFVSNNNHRHYYWEDDNVIDGIDSDKEAYEGFSSCKNHYWDSSEEDDYEDDSNWKIKGYYDSMRKEFDPSYDLEYDPWKDDEDETNN